MYTLNTAIDQLTTARRTVRAFTEQPLEKEKLEAVIEAGRRAPFAGLVNSEVPSFRRFFVVKRGSQTAEKLKALAVTFRAEELQRAREGNWAGKYPAYVGNLEKLQGTADDLFPAETLVVVAERAGRPVREETTLGTVIESMWLKAVALNLGFTFRSVVGDITDKSAMKALFGLEPDENYAFDACCMGYAKGDNPRTEPRETPLPSITYMD